MPEEMIRYSVKMLCPYGLDLVEEPAVKVLANKYKVSEQMMIIRLCQLGYFDI